MRSKSKVQVWVGSCADPNDFHSYEFLLLKVNPKRGSFWQPITGSVEKSDSSFLVAAQRELEEEVGFSSKQKFFDLGFSFSFQNSRQENFEEHLFLSMQEKKDPVLSSEHVDFKWCNESQVKEMLFFESNLDCFKKILNFLKSQR